MNHITITGFFQGVEDKGRWGVATVKQPSRRKRDGEFVTEYIWWDVNCFEKQLPLLKSVEKGTFVTILGEVIMDEVSSPEKGKRRFYKIGSPTFQFAPKQKPSEERPKAAENTQFGGDDDDIPF